MRSENIFKSPNGKKDSLLKGLSWKSWIGLIVALFLLAGFGFGQYNKVLKTKTPVSEKQVKQAVSDRNQVVFYRDDCPSTMSKCYAIVDGT